MTYRNDSRLFVRASICICVGITMCLTAGAAADEIVKKDGAVLTGRIVSETPAKVVVEIVKYGCSTSITVFRKDIVRIVRAKPEDPATGSTAGSTAKPTPKGPGYFEIPISGEIGREVDAATLTKTLNVAKAKCPDYIILVLDSAGGSVSETQLMLAALRKHSGPKPIALVRRATSTAALLAMACPSIYVLPDAKLGGIVPYTSYSEATPKPTESQFASAIRGPTQLAAEMGGHPKALLDAMTDPAIELSVVKGPNGVPTIVPAGDGQLLSPKGKVMMLTARDATGCGLAKGLVRDFSGLSTALGLISWRPVSAAGKQLMRAKATAAKKAREKKIIAESRRVYMENIAPELAELDKRLSKVRTDGKSALSTKTSLQRQYNSEISLIESDYRRDKSDADRRADDDPQRASRLRRQAKNRYEDRLAQLRNRCQPQAAEVQTKINRLAQEQARLVIERKRLLAGAP